MSIFRAFSRPESAIASIATKFRSAALKRFTQLLNVWFFAAFFLLLSLDCLPAAF
jgi:hypothetical protein